MLLLRAFVIVFSPFIQLHSQSLVLSKPPCAQEGMQERWVSKSFFRVLLRVAAGCLILVVPLIAHPPTLSEAPRALHAANRSIAKHGVDRLLAPQSSTWIDTSNRAAVQTSYLSTFVPTRSVLMGWVGDLNTGNAGTTAQAYRDAVATRINWLRSLAGIASNVVLSDALNQEDQQAALMLSVNGQLSHFPPTSWTYYTAAGAEALQNSNICLGFPLTDPGCVETYMQDAGSLNTVAGHRRWLLYPQTTTMGTGDVPGSLTPSRPSANALWVIDYSTYGSSRPATRDAFIAWPPKGYVPYQLVYPRWSFSYAGADFSNASVSMTRNGVSVPVRLESLGTGYGENSIVWVPDNQDASTSITPVSPGGDVTSAVTISNVAGAGVPSTFTYNVTVFDPAPATGTTFSLNPTTMSIGNAGGIGTVALTESPAGTSWQATSNASWITITSGASGTSSATVAYSIAANTTAASRTGTLTIAGQTFTIQQDGAASNTLTLSMSTTIALYNTSSAFSLSAGNLTPQTRTLTLSASTGTVAYTSAVTGSPRFVTLTPPTGTTPSTITLTANPAGLNVGTYSNTVTFTSGTATVGYTVSLIIQPMIAAGVSPPAKVSIFRASSGLFLLDRNGDGTCCDSDLVGTIGQIGDIPLGGDWTGDGLKKFGLYRSSTGLFLLDVNNNGSFDGTATGKDKALFFSAQSGDVPVVGDWTGTGIDRVGVFRASNGTWYLDTKGDGSFVGRAYLGQTGDIPLVGNWNGVGTATKVGIYRPFSVNGQPGNFFLVDTNGDGVYTSADQPLFFLGQAGDVPIIGDWNGDGRSKVGVFRPAGSGNGPGLMVLDQNGSFSWDGPATDRVLYFAPYLTGLTSSTTIQPGDLPVTGNWVPSYAPPGNPSVPKDRTRVGIYRPSTGTFFLDVTADGTFQGRAFFGQSGDVPLGVPTVFGGSITGVNGLGMF